MLLVNLFSLLINLQAEGEAGNFKLLLNFRLVVENLSQVLELALVTILDNMLIEEG